MAQTSAGTGPIPPAKKDDTEDVAWALSTAEAMFARGDRGDALKWLRRAAEAASEAQADDRALELAKAAADLASSIGPVTSVPPPPPPPPAASAAPPPAPAGSAAPPPAPPVQRMAPMPAQAQAPTQTPLPGRPPAKSAPPPPPAAAPVVPTPPKSSPRPQGTPPKPRALSPFAPAGAPPGPARRTRRSRPEITIGRPPDEVTQSMATDEIPSPHPPEPKRRGRASRPAVEEVTPLAVPVAPASDATPVPERETMPGGDAVRAALSAQTDEMDAWPTQSLLGDDLSDPPDEKTRIGVPAYEASARLASEASSPATPLTPAPPQATSNPALRASQAVRVVVWRAADGVHVAPQGTRVSAISVDAVLVALDPSADLAAWLSGK